MENYFKATDNNMGYELLKIDCIAKSFVKYASDNPDWVLEIGSANGNLVEYALRHNLQICCNDISNSHINKIKDKYKRQRNIKYYIGDFLNIQYNRKFQAILISRVLHFLNPERLENSFKLFSNLLNNNGKVFITVETPYLGNWINFLEEYEKRSLNSEIEYPGYISDTYGYESKGYQNNLPKEVHWLNKSDFLKLSEKFNFEIEHMEYIDRKDYFPPDLLLDGRESLGVILRKKSV
ncbi:class I SAM-dependent methyltransferase [Thiotrichales bacterium 19X7-9]|nr:class I SAM-dependent methyltransferase [Thiotrichales bacterium 19X7-9]